jgi:dihydrodipicolinate synthase/N-acetylneuraminate lyase
MPTPKFKAGISGNPKGRPKDKTPATLLRKSIIDDMPEIILKLAEQAKNGDTAAAKILLDRCCPTLKPQALAISLPINGSLAEQGGEIIRATLSGHIPPDLGAQLINALANQGKLIELQELTQRLDNIEKKLTHEQSLEYLK